MDACGLVDAPSTCGYGEHALSPTSAYGKRAQSRSPLCAYRSPQRRYSSQVKPAEAINLVEVLLRGLVRQILGEDWKQHQSVDVARLEELRGEEVRKRRGAIVSNDLLDFTEFTQLQRIILGNWERFKPALGNKKYIDVYFERLNGFRNPAMHSRELLPFEVDLVHGIVGELRNILAIYRSNMSDAMAHYPSIDLVSDQFGNCYTHPTEFGARAVATGLRLALGETLTFTCMATDPLGRDLRWIVRAARGEVNAYKDTPLGTWEGAESVIHVPISEEYVGEHFVVNIVLRSNSIYARHPYDGSFVAEFDDACSFVYAVNPPHDNSRAPS